MTAIQHPAAAEKSSASGATVTYAGKTHELRIHGICGAGPEGAYNIWAVTPDETEPSVAKENAPRLHAYSNGEWSRLEFYAGGTELTAGVAAEGPERVLLNDGLLRYEGPANDRSEAPIKIHLEC